MALRTPPSWLQAGSHPAENDRNYTKAFIVSEGITRPTDLAVTAAGGMNLSVALGWAFINGTVTASQGTYQVYNDAATTLLVAPANPTNPRIDRVVITVNDSAYGAVSDNAVLQIITGTPAASPSAPAVPANSLSLATVAVAAGATSINSGNITDTRVLAVTIAGAGGGGGAGLQDIFLLMGA